MSDQAKNYPAAGGDPSSWPVELDALIAAAENHQLLFENERVRVLDTAIQPGQKTPIHTHCWPASMYVIGIDHFVRRDGRGQVMVDTRETNPSAKFPQVLWSEPLGPHSLENVGAVEIRVISVELKG